MYCRSVRVVALAATGVLSVPILGSARPELEQPKQERSKSPKKAPEKQASLSGCIDEQDGRYVLIHEQSRDLVAQLEADGFETEGFAKHLGHKVTVRGTANSSGTDRPVFKVRSIETLSEHCGPQEHEQ